MKKSSKIVTTTDDDSEWLKLRQQVLERDKYTCRQCGCTDGLMYVHYVVPKRLGGLDALDNLITLCSKKCGELYNSESEEAC